MKERSEFVVEVVETVSRTFVFTAWSRDEAVSLAEQALEEGETGEVTYREIETADAYPYDEYTFSDDDEDED